MLSRRAAAAAAAPAIAVAMLLSGCSPTVPADAAADANDPACAEVISRVRTTLATLDDAPYRQTDAQGTAAWGDPASVLLTCGIDVPQASELPCVQVDGVYWLRNDERAPTYIFTTFGRDPAVDVAVDNDIRSTGIVLGDLTPAVSTLPTNGLECTDIESTL